MLHYELSCGVWTRYHVFCFNTFLLVHSKQFKVTLSSPSLCLCICPSVFGVSYCFSRFLMLLLPRGTFAAAKEKKNLLRNFVTRSYCGIQRQSIQYYRWSCAIFVSKRSEWRSGVCCRLLNSNSWRWCLWEHTDTKSSGLGIFSA
jgi:hypothetical protein